MWVGFGTGQICDGCDLPITRDQREFEFDPPGRPTIRLHADCLEFWDVERAAPATRTTAPRISAILREGFPSGYCVECLAARLELPACEVRDAAQVLVAERGFRVVERVCYTCGRIRHDVVVFDGGLLS
jgi:hypothetical protein